MTEHDFLEAVHEAKDDSSRLVYADWLDDLGDPRGQLIRLSVEMRKLLAENEIDPAWMEVLRIQVERPIIKHFGLDFHSGGGALTLNRSAVSEDDVEGGIHQRFHRDTGWTIRGEVHEDYYVWVNEFEARHPQFGRVWGNFEDKVFADSEEGFQDFYAKHTPEAWDYMDI